MLDFLPQLSLDLSPTSGSRPADPTQKYWTAPVVHVLAQKAKYQPRVWVPQTDTLWLEVVTAAGYDITKPDTLPRPLNHRVGKSRKQGLLDLAYYAAFYARGDISRPAPIPLTIKQGNKWALTEAGVAVATKIRPHFIVPEVAEANPDTRNVTCLWLEAELAKGLYDHLLRVVSCNTSTAREREAGEVMDHVNHYFATAIRRDAYRTRIEAGDPPRWGQITEWCLRATWSTFKKRARMPLFREGRGARTEKERENGTIRTDALIASEHEVVIQSREEVGSPNLVVNEVLVDTEAHHREMHRIDFDRGMSKIEEAFRVHKPGNHDRISRIWKLYAEGHTVEEIGQLEGVSRNRAASLLADVRKALRDAEQTATNAAIVLEYIAENPWSATADVVADVPGVDVPLILKRLVELGRLEAKDFVQTIKSGSTRKRKTVTGYTVTDRGHAYVRARSTLDPNDLFSRISM